MVAITSPNAADSLSSRSARVAPASSDRPLQPKRSCPPALTAPDSGSILHKPISLSCFLDVLASGVKAYTGNVTTRARMRATTYAGTTATTEAIQLQSHNHQATQAAAPIGSRLRMTSNVIVEADLGGPVIVLKGDYARDWQRRVDFVALKAKELT